MKKPTTKALSKKSLKDVNACLPKKAKKILNPQEAADAERERLVSMSREEFDEMMCKRFPLIFIDRTKPMSETCMCWGFDVGQGWYPLILDLCRKMDFVCKSGGDVIHVVADQVKEKFASMRFYWHTALVDKEAKELSPAGQENANMVYEVVDDLVNHADEVSGRTCEQCGDYGEHRVHGGWHVTLCNKHDEERRKKIEADMKKWKAQMETAQARMASESAMTNAKEKHQEEVNGIARPLPPARKSRKSKA